MTYDTHFLSRLERASKDEVNFALFLYYDSNLTSEIIKLFTLANKTDRLAIALSDSEEPSHVILANDGSFITCLGPGMKLDNIPVITKSRFKGLTKQNETLRDKEAKTMAFLEAEGGLNSLHLVLFKSGRNLTREQFKIWDMLQPLLFTSLLEIHAQVIERATELSFDLQPVARRGIIRSKKDRKNVRKFWEAKWTIGHIAMLLCSDTILINKMSKRWLSTANLASICMLERMLPISLMGLWFVSKIGQHIFPAMKKMLLEPKKSYFYIDAAFILAAIAFRHSRYKSEVIKLLNRKISGFSENDLKFCTIVKTNLSLVLTKQKHFRKELDEFVLEYFEREPDSL